MKRELPPAGYKTQSADTNYGAERMLFDHWRTLQPRQKAELVAALVSSVHRLSLTGLRMRHPQASERELELRAAALRIGRDWVRRATGIDVPPEDVRIA